MTGGASGIGRAASERFAEAGATVVVADVNSDAGEATAAAITMSGARALFLSLDVTCESDWESLVFRVDREFGRLDVLLNNAGVFLIQPLRQTSLEQWNHIMAVNVTGIFLGMKHCAPYMAHCGGGAIVNVSSAAAMAGASGMVAYGASKGAVRTMTKDVAVEYGPANVRVNSVHPGWINTHMAEYGARESNVTVEQLSEGTPLGRIGAPDDVADLLVFLASNEARWITGAEMVVDGGRMAGQTSAPMLSSPRQHRRRS